MKPAEPNCRSESGALQHHEVLLLAFHAELAAGGVDVGAFSFPDGDRDAEGFQDGDELAGSGSGGFGEGEFFHAVHGNQVDVGNARFK